MHLCRTFCLTRINYVRNLFILSRESIAYGRVRLANEKWNKKSNALETLNSIKRISAKGHGQFGPLHCSCRGRCRCCLVFPLHGSSISSISSRCTIVQSYFVDGVLRRVHKFWRRFLGHSMLQLHSVYVGTVQRTNVFSNIRCHTNGTVRSRHTSGHGVSAEIIFAEREIHFVFSEQFTEIDRCVHWDKSDCTIRDGISVVTKVVYVRVTVCVYLVLNIHVECTSAYCYWHKSNRIEYKV